MSADLVLSQQNGVAARDFMPVFNIDQAVERRNAMVSFVQKIMVDGTDFGKIPGVEKASLFKAGAEKLCTFFGLSPEFILSECIEDWIGSQHKDEPFFYYRYKCRLVKNGRVIGEGDGSSNSWESKYRYRWIEESQLPESFDRDKLLKKDSSTSEPAFAIDKAETGGRYGKPAEYWQRFKDAIQDGTARRTTRKKKTGEDMDAWEIPSTSYRIPNPDVADVVNTIQKMAQKRALVGAVLVGVNASEYFTQDIEDMQPLDSPAPRNVDHIDTGGAPIGTQQAADNVAKRKIEEIRSAPAPTTELAPEITAMWARMTDKFSALKVFGELKEAYKELVGSDTAYYAQLKKAGVAKSDEFPSMGKARLCARFMYEEIQSLASMNNATDDSHSWEAPA